MSEAGPALRRAVLIAGAPRLALAAAMLLPAMPAQAECLGQGCYSGLGVLIIGAAICALILAGLVIWMAWRWRFMRWVVALIVLGAFLVPLVRNQISARQVAATHAGDILGNPPALADRVPLLITRDSYCDMVCIFLVGAAGPRGIVMISEDARQLEREPDQVQALLNGTIPDLARLPLERWRNETEYGWNPVVEPLLPAERSEFLADLDYVLLTGSVQPYDDGGEVGTSLDRQLQDRVPQLAGLGATQQLRVGLAALPAPGVLDLGALRFDLLEFVDLAQHYPVPLYWGGITRMDATLRPESAAALIRSACQGAEPALQNQCEMAGGTILLGR